MSYVEITTVPAIIDKTFLNRFIENQATLAERQDAVPGNSVLVGTAAGHIGGIHLPFGAMLVGGSPFVRILLCPTSEQPCYLVVQSDGTPDWESEASVQHRMDTAARFRRWR